MVQTEVVEHTDTVVVTDTVDGDGATYRPVLVAEGLGPVSGQLTDAVMSSRGVLVTEQRGVVQKMNGTVVFTVGTPATAFGGLLGIAELDGVVYMSYTDSVSRLTVADEHGRILYRTVPYDIQHFGGGLATYDGRLLLGYGNRRSFTGPGDPRDGGVMAIDVSNGAADTIAVGLRNPFKLTVWGDQLIVSSSGEFLYEGLYRLRLGGSAPVDFGYPVWEGPVCHTEPDCPDHTPAWYTYPTAAFGCSAVVGGAVWRDLYWFSDFCEGWVRTIDAQGHVRYRFDLPGRIGAVRRVGDDLVILGYDGGKVWRVIRDQPS